MKKKRYYVYLLSNRSKMLYTGVTNNLERRITEHRNKTVKGYTTRYNLYMLVYFEEFQNPLKAIAQEKEIKGWCREKKIQLIERKNPFWNDLAADGELS